jgi:NAD(P)H-hydrate repair Nnr-like enzyme with NAD(P)H-hydrate dehydratase domain
VIVDAGMFDILKDHRQILDSLKNCKVVFTPHPGELKRFLDGKNEPWIDLVDRFPLEKEHVLVAKSHASFIRTQTDVRIVPYGAKALAFGGTGDALTGILGFETVKNGLEKGAERAVLRHRLAGILLEKDLGESCHDMDKLLEFIGETGK